MRRKNLQYLWMESSTAAQTPSTFRSLRETWASPSLRGARSASWPWWWAWLGWLRQMELCLDLVTLSMGDGEDKLVASSELVLGYLGRLNRRKHIKISFLDTSQSWSHCSIMFLFCLSTAECARYSKITKTAGF